MNQPQQRTTAPPATAATAGGEQERASVAPSGSGRQVSSPEAGGQTTIAETVVAKIASLTAREIPGVHDLGSGMARTWGSIRERIPGSGGTATAQGVSVEVGERQAAVDVDVVVDYGVPIVEVARGIRRAVIEAVEGMTGLEVVEVNVSVGDIHVAGEEREQTRVE